MWSFEAVTVNPSGIAVILSPWLIKTSSEVDNPWKIPESVLNTSTFAGPYSLVGEGSTVPPNK